MLCPYPRVALLHWVLNFCFCQGSEGVVGEIQLATEVRNRSSQQKFTKPATLSKVRTQHFDVTARCYRCIDLDRFRIP